MFQAIVDYHNKLAQTRFTIAALYLTATSFLANSWFANSENPASYPAIPVLGLVFTVVCVFLEYRTRQLLTELGNRGRPIEGRLLGRRLAQEGFFDLMENQLSKSPVSHTLAFYLLYGSITIFWLCALSSGAWVLYYQLP
jgi:hypothetical protein